MSKKHSTPTSYLLPIGSNRDLGICTEMQTVYAVLKAAKDKDVIQLMI